MRYKRTDEYKGGFVYIMTNKLRTVLYVGVTSDLIRRVWHHQSETGSTFTSRYKCTDLIFFEEYSTIKAAIDREKQIKNWQREWKLDLVRGLNPELKTLEL